MSSSHLRARTSYRSEVDLGQRLSNFRVSMRLSPPALFLRRLLYAHSVRFDGDIKPGRAQAVAICWEHTHRRGSQWRPYRPTVDRTGRHALPLESESPRYLVKAKPHFRRSIPLREDRHGVIENKQLFLCRYLSPVVATLAARDRGCLGILQMPRSVLPFLVRRDTYNLCDRKVAECRACFGGPARPPL